MNYNTGINWGLFFNQVDLIHYDKPVYISNFFPNPQKFLTWNDISIILNNSFLEWRIIEKERPIKIPTYNSFTGDNFQNKKFIQNCINNGNTFIIEKCVTYNEYIKTLLNEVENHFKVAAGAHIFGSKNKEKTSSYFPHIDDNPLFIFNIEGITKWSLFSNNSSFLFDREEINSNFEIDKLTLHSEHILSPGDFLYIPTRFFHKASPDVQYSHRLSLNIATFSNLKDFKVDKNYYKI